MTSRMNLQESSLALPSHSSIIQDSCVPKYQQIALILKDGILSGTYSVGSYLPSETEICRCYGVSRITARQALDTLAHQSLARRIRGKGTVVERVTSLPPLRASVSKWLDSTRAMGLHTRVRMLDVSWGVASFEEGAALQIDIGAAVQRAERVRLTNGMPFSFLRTVLPEEVANTIDIDQLSSVPLLQLIVRAGNKISHAEQTVTAVLANQAIADHLSTEPGSAILKLQRIVYGCRGAPIEYLTAFYRPDRYQLEMVLDSDQETLRMGNTGDGTGVW